ncbi:HD domain-containing protein [Polymorphospora sp. NPDC051019]|uniref:HD domain-containing protein n=1 Tax=Polymorphospora sp. NPDC051019 TaxID=3155725 RepID=UPI003441FA65
MTNLKDRAARDAEIQLAAALPRRWQHVQAVALKAERLGSLVGPDADLLTAAAWLHDIGYAPSLAKTGLHALDGARWLAKQGYNMRLAALVAHHSCAQFEADERELGKVLEAEFPREVSATADALWYADMTTGPDGQELTVKDRLTEIRERYGPNDPVTRFWERAETTLFESVQRTELRLANQPM